MRGNAHVRCGGRRRAVHRAQARHGGSPPTLDLRRPADPRNVKRWRSGEMCLLWTAAGMLEAETRFRKVEGYRGLATLAVKIEQDLIRNRHLDSYTSDEEELA